MTNIASYIADLNAAFDARVAYETAKNADNSSMQNTLKSLRDMTKETVAKHLLSSAVDASFINRAERSNNRYNVYAAQKVENIAICADTATAQLNHYTLAILRVAVALEAIDSQLSHKDAVSACSASVKHSEAKRESIIKSLRYAKHVAANTASTQSSSSINALQTFNMLTETRDAANNVTYRVNRENEALKTIAARYEIAL